MSFWSLSNSFFFPFLLPDDSFGSAQNGGKVSLDVSLFATGIPNTPVFTKKNSVQIFHNRVFPSECRSPPVFTLTLCVKLKSKNALIQLATLKSHATLGPITELGKFCRNRSNPLHSPALCCDCRGTAWELVSWQHAWRPSLDVCWCEGCFQFPQLEKIPYLMSMSNVIGWNKVSFYLFIAVLKVSS